MGMNLSMGQALVPIRTYNSSKLMYFNIIQHSVVVNIYNNVKKI